MMQFRTQFPLKRQEHNQIDYNSKIVLFGSCFTETIGAKFAYYKFQKFSNPFGIYFHPKAIENLILSAINRKVYTENDLFFHNERWHCFEAHSSLSTTNKDELISNLNIAIETTNKQLSTATHIVITLGTAWMYRFVETDSIVANCHKIPQKKFLKELLSVDELTESLLSIVALIRNVNKNASILFTVSPVRHLKDGVIENQQSKAHLIAAVHQVTEPRNGIHYFPSYEIVMDELRDYRFYAEDMIHPNQTAIDYIWEQFAGSWISTPSHATMKEVDTIQKGLLHRPFDVHATEHQQFLKNLEEKIKILLSRYPQIKFD
tara:strand:- start:139493 stop:140449 length:957 start_codon:yes stop_codon:yes gene_type:complete